MFRHNIGPNIRRCTSTSPWSSRWSSCSMDKTGKIIKLSLWSLWRIQDKSIHFRGCSKCMPRFGRVVRKLLFSIKWTMNRCKITIKLTMRKFTLTQIGYSVTLMSLNYSIRRVPIQIMKNTGKNIIFSDIFNLDSSDPDSEFTKKRMSGAIQSSDFIRTQIIYSNLEVKSCSMRIQKPVWFYFPSYRFTRNPGILGVYRNKRNFLNRIWKTLRFGCAILEGVWNFSRYYHIVRWRHFFTRGFKKFFFLKKYYKN